MAVNYRDGDLFCAHEQTLVNTVNCCGIMGKGIALEFKKRYPRMFRDYVDRCRRRAGDPRKLEIGRPYVFEEAGRLVLNFPTKEHWRYPSKPEYIERGLQYFVDHYREWGITSVAFPRLGCENGGLNWESQVRPLMERYLSEVDIRVVVVTYRPSDPTDRDAMSEADLEEPGQLSFEGVGRPITRVNKNRARRKRAMTTAVPPRSRTTRTT